MRLSRLTILFGLFIVISASFMRQVLDFFYAAIGKQATINSLGVFCVLLFLYIFAQALKSKVSIGRKAAFFVVLALGFYFSWQLKIAAERIHILEYGLFGYLAARDLWKKPISAKPAILIFLAVALFAFLDEGFQYILPYRYWDLRDIVFNLTGGAWGFLLFLIKNPLCFSSKAFS